MINTPGIYEIPATEYHADPCPEPSLSASVARTLIDRSPLHAWMQHPRMAGQQDRESQATRMSLGTAAHCGNPSGRLGLHRVSSMPTASARKRREKQRDRIIESGGTPLLEKDRVERLRRWLLNLNGRGSIEADSRRNAL